MADPDGESQPTDTNDGSVSIIAAVAGDADCDGDADVADVTGILGELSGVRPEGLARTQTTMITSTRWTS